jgi:hypothetical protein
VVASLTGKTRKPMVSALAILSMATAVPLSARTIFPPIGYLKHSGSWDNHCPQDKFLVGFRGRWIARFRSLKIVCASISSAGGRGVLWYGPDHGQSGGDYQEFSCPRDSAIMGLKVSQLLYKGEFVGIEGLTALCVSRVSAALTTFTIGAHYNTARPEASGNSYPQRCPTGESGSGINGRSDGSTGIMAVGFDCAVRRPT